MGQDSWEAPKRIPGCMFFSRVGRVQGSIRHDRRGGGQLTTQPVPLFFSERFR